MLVGLLKDELEYVVWQFVHGCELGLLDSVLPQLEVDFCDLTKEIVSKTFQGSVFGFKLSKQLYILRFRGLPINCVDQLKPGSVIVA